HYAGDGITVFFNDPLPTPDPAKRAFEMAVAMRATTQALLRTWRRHGHDIGFGVGISQGYATLGQIGFAERVDYTGDCAVAAEQPMPLWALLCPASLRCARSRQAGPQKRDHRRAGRKSASHPSQWRVSTTGSGASALRPFAGSLSRSSATGDETHFCPVPLPRKTTSGGSLHRARRNVRSPSLKV